MTDIYITSLSYLSKFLVFMDVYRACDFFFLSDVHLVFFRESI